MQTADLIFVSFPFDARCL